MAHIIDDEEEIFVDNNIIDEEMREFFSDDFGKAGDEFDETDNELPWK